MPIDYSKWDHCLDDDGSDDGARHSNVRVTRLDEPSTIHVGADQSISIQPPRQADRRVVAVDHPMEPSRPTTHSKTEKEEVDKEQPITLWYTERHGNYITEYRYGWIQDRTTVTIRWELASRDDARGSAKKSTYQVTLTHAARDKYSAGDTGGAKSHVKVTCTTTRANDERQILIDSDLYCPVYLPPEHDGHVDWEILTTPGETTQKVLSMTLYKAMPTTLVSTVWWKQCLLAYETPKDAVERPVVASSQHQLQQAWDDAHASVATLQSQQQQTPL